MNITIKMKTNSEMCGKGCSQECKIKVHMRLHTRHLLSVSYIYKFFSSNLKQHMRSDTRESPFNCKVCGKGFSENSKTVIHVRYTLEKHPLNVKYRGFFYDC